MTVAQTQKINAYTVTPTLDTSAYADGDVMGTSATGLTLHTGFPSSRVTGIIHDVRVVDNDKEAKNFDIYVLDREVSMGTDNAAVTWSDAEALATQGLIQVTTYLTSTNNSVSMVDEVDLPFLATVSGGGPTDTAILYFGFVARASVTYTAATDLSIEFKISLD
tara:strand:- start:98 stop:589 length:492 start_codon:yes stop_codon:yes gene_type:complete